MAKRRGRAFNTPAKERTTFEQNRPVRSWLTMDFYGPPCKTLADMTEAEIVAIEQTYGAPVIRPC